jgi:hypothetical protein
MPTEETAARPPHANENAGKQRKKALLRVIEHADEYPNFPLQQVRDILDFWKINL